MSHKHMARGSKVAATSPAITAFAGKVRPAAIRRRRLARSCPLTSLTARGHDDQEGTGSGECDRYPARTHTQRFTTVTLYHGPRSV